MTKKDVSIELQADDTTSHEYYLPPTSQKVKRYENNDHHCGRYIIIGYAIEHRCVVVGKRVEAMVGPVKADQVP